jgi:hypothetical protein
MEMLQIKVAEKIKTHILYSVFFFVPPENCAICEIMRKNVELEGPHDNMVYVLWMLYNKGYTQDICCFSRATVVT